MEGLFKDIQGYYHREVIRKAVPMLRADVLGKHIENLNTILMTPWCSKFPAFEKAVVELTQYTSRCHTFLTEQKERDMSRHTSEECLRNPIGLGGLRIL